MIILLLNAGATEKVILFDKFGFEFFNYVESHNMKMRKQINLYPQKDKGWALFITEGYSTKEYYLLTTFKSALETVSKAECERECKF